VVNNTTLNGPVVLAWIAGDVLITVYFVTVQVATSCGLRSNALPGSTSPGSR